MSQSEQKLPPLPELAIRPRKWLSQDVADRVMRMTYSERPDIFISIGEIDTLIERDPSRAHDPQLKERFDSVGGDFDHYIRDRVRQEMKLPLSLDVQTDLFFELRRRARVMHGLSV